MATASFNTSTTSVPVQIGLVGYGWWGKTIAKQIAVSRWLELAAVAESHEPTRALMAGTPCCRV